MRINRYTQAVIATRSTPDLVDQGALQNAGLIANSAAQVADLGAQIVERERQVLNETKVNEATVAYKKDLLEASDAFRQQNMGTPEDASNRFENDFAKKIAKRYQSGLLDSDAKKEFDARIQNVNLGFFESNQNWERSRNLELSAQRVENTAQNINTIMYRKGQSGESVDDVFVDIQRTIEAEKTFLAPEVVENSIKTMKSGAIQNYLEGQLDAGKYNSVKEQLDSGAYDEALSSDKLQRLYKITSAEKKRREAEFVAKQENTLNNEYRSMIDFQALGIGIDKDQAAELAQRARSLGNERMAQDISMRVETQDIVSDFVGQPLSNQQAMLSSMVETMSVDRTPENLFKFKAVQEAFQAKQEALSDGRALEYYQQTGVISKLAPLRVDNPQSFINDFALRKNAQTQIFKKDGILIPPLSKQEITAMSERYKQLPAKDRMAFLSTFANVFEQNDAAAIAQVMAKDEPSLAGIMAIIKENPKAAEDAILGGQREKTIPRNDVLENLTKNYADAVADPEAFNAITDIVHNVLAQEMFAKGETIATEDMVNKVAKSIIGEKIEYGRTAVLPFRKSNNQFISEGEFKSLTRKTTVDLLKTKFGSAPYVANKEISNSALQSMLRKWSLVTTGDGIYELRNPWDQNQVLVGKDGAPYEFNFKQLANDVDMRGFFERTASDLFKGATDTIAVLPSEGE